MYEVVFNNKVGGDPGCVPVFTDHAYSVKRFCWMQSSSIFLTDRLRWQSGRQFQHPKPTFHCAKLTRAVRLHYYRMWQMEPWRQSGEVVRRPPKALVVMAKVQNNSNQFFYCSGFHTPSIFHWMCADLRIFPSRELDHMLEWYVSSHDKLFLIIRPVIS